MTKTTTASHLTDFAAIGRSCYCLHSRMAARALTRHYNNALAPAGIEVTEFSLLAAISLDRDHSITQLADRLAFERTSLVRNLKRLDSRGLIAAASGGGRAVKYTLTPDGRAALARAVWTHTQQEVQNVLGRDAVRVSNSLSAVVRAARRLEHDPLLTAPIE